MMVWLQATTTTFLWQMFLLFLSLFVKILSFIISLTTFGPRLIYNTTTKKWNKVCIETSLATECKKATIFIFGKFYFSWLFFFSFSFQNNCNFLKTSTRGWTTTTTRTTTLYNDSPMDFTTGSHT